MPRRTLLSDTERDSLLVLPESQNDLIQQYSLTDADLALIRQRRGAANRLGFAVQMCLLRYPGYAILRARIEAFLALPLDELRGDRAKLNADLDRIGQIEA